MVRGVGPGPGLAGGRRRLGPLPDPDVDHRPRRLLGRRAAERADVPVREAARRGQLPQPGCGPGDAVPARGGRAQAAGLRPWTQHPRRSAGPGGPRSLLPHGRSRALRRAGPRDRLRGRSRRVRGDGAARERGLQRRPLPRGGAGCHPPGLPAGAPGRARAAALGRPGPPGRLPHSGAAGSRLVQAGRSCGTWPTSTPTRTPCSGTRPSARRSRPASPTTRTTRSSPGPRRTGRPPTRSATPRVSRSWHCGWSGCPGDDLGRFPPSGQPEAAAGSPTGPMRHGPARPRRHPRERSYRPPSGTTSARPRQPPAARSSSSRPPAPATSSSPASGRRASPPRSSVPSTSTPARTSSRRRKWPPSPRSGTSKERPAQRTSAASTPATSGPRRPPTPLARSATCWQPSRTSASRCTDPAPPGAGETGGETGPALHRTRRGRGPVRTRVDRGRSARDRVHPPPRQETPPCPPTASAASWPRSASAAS